MFENDSRQEVNARRYGLDATCHGTIEIPLALVMMET
jgi:hypothetical protein